MSDCWVVKVLRAFAQVMDDGKPVNVQCCEIGWVKAARCEGPYAPFVWLDVDASSFVDGRESHQATFVTGVIFRKDVSEGDTEHVQGLNAYYALRQKIAAAADNTESAFNDSFIGLVHPSEDQPGVRPGDTKDYDGHHSIGERWQVIGSTNMIGADGA